ncbi:MAG: methionyl-tRNA formyltransferase [Anaerovoracaceae bacterium]|nr:methionyl-tRNA formyltransferase [Anaerovoracaceae bacterium]
MKTVFMGTPDFAAEVLRRLYDSENSVELVITQPDRAKNRGKKIQPTPVKELAGKHNTPVYQPEKIRKDEQVMEKLKAVSPDVIVVAAYGQILPEEILNLPEYGCINVHASLLPRLRGASPIQHAIINGDEKTGVTIMQMAKGLDTGDMLAKTEIEIGSMNGQQLHDALARIGGNLLVDTLKLISEGKVIPEPQDNTLATYAGMISKKDGRIDFCKSPDEIERLIRGFDPWPGAFCSLDGETIKIWKAEASDDTSEAPPGSIIFAGETGIGICCGGKILNVTEIQAPGKKRMKVSDYLRGHKILKGNRFE